MRGLDREGLPLAWRHGHIRKNLLGSNAIHGTKPPKVPTHDANLRAIVVLDHGDVGGFHFLIAWCCHFEH